MTRNELFDLLNEKLGGEEIDTGYSFILCDQIENAIKQILKEQGINVGVISNINIGYSTSNSLILRYKANYICTIQFSKQKGVYKGIRYEWTFKKFFCGDQSEDFDFMKKVYEIEINLIKQAEQKRKTEQEMFECYKQVNALFGDKTDSIIRYLEKHSYDLRKQLEREGK